MTSLGWLGKLLHQGILRPRETAARVLAQRPGLDAVVLMVALGYLIESMGRAAVFATTGGGWLAEIDTTPPVQRHLAGIIFTVFLFMIAAGIANWFGRVMGGHGDLQRVTAAIALAVLLESALQPFMILLLTMVEDPQTMPGGVALLLMVLFGYTIWIVASCIAEAHGFKRTFPVAGAVVGFLFLTMLTLPLFGIQLA